jgi:hypothetical protein
MLKWHFGIIGGRVIVESFHLTPLFLYFSLLFLGCVLCVFGATGTARMDYDTGGDGQDHRLLEANQNFFHSLYDHAVMASRRGCRRSSLELMKLLYQLDARDPMGVLLGTWRWCRHKTGAVIFTGLFVSLLFLSSLDVWQVTIDIVCEHWKKNI